MYCILYTYYPNIGPTGVHIVQPPGWLCLTSQLMTECPLPRGVVLVRQVCLPSAPVRNHTLIIAGVKRKSGHGISEVFTQRLRMPRGFLVPEQSSLRHCLFATSESIVFRFEN